MFVFMQFCFNQALTQALGKVVDWADHAFEEGILYIRVRFTDRAELCWRIVNSTVIEEADLSDWKTGNFRQLRVLVQSESDGE
jgi:hypothetical protein